MEDVAIIHSGNKKISCLVPLLVQKLRESLRTEVFTWSTNDSNFRVSNHGKNLKKLATSSWGTPVHVTIPLPNSKLVYFQTRINDLNKSGSGIFFGVSKGNKSNIDWSGPTAICIYNTSGTGLDQRSVEHTSGYNAKEGDVIGVVVDMEKDQVRFYNNTNLIAVSTRKPSEMAPLYVVAWLYYQHCELENGDFFPYQSLKQNYKDRL
jgi:hypothetical protein